MVTTKSLARLRRVVGARRRLSMVFGRAGPPVRSGRVRGQARSAGGSAVVCAR